MARIQGLPKKCAGWLARIAYRASTRKLRTVAEPLAIAAHNPWILAGYGAYEMALERAQRVDMRLKVLAELKAGALVGCPF